MSLDHTILYITDDFFSFYIVDRLGTNMKIAILQSFRQFFALQRQPIHCFCLVVFECLQRFGTFLIGNLKRKLALIFFFIKIKKQFVWFVYILIYHRQLLHCQYIGNEMCICKIIINDGLVDGLAFLRTIQSNVV